MDEFRVRVSILEPPQPIAKGLSKALRAYEIVSPEGRVARRVEEIRDSDGRIVPGAGKRAFNVCRELNHRRFGITKARLKAQSQGQGTVKANGRRNSRVKVYFRNL